MEIKRKRISPFIEWAKTHKKVNESEIAIEVDWWDDCKAEVLKQLEDECAGILLIDKIIEFVKMRNVILGRDYDFNVGDCVKEHIKDLIFQFHWHSIVNDGDGCSADDNTALHSMGLAIETLANEIYERILEKSGADDFDNAPTTIVADSPKADTDDDLPFDEKKVMKFKDYTKSVNESTAMIDSQTKSQCIDACLKRIKEEVGSYGPYEILMTALDVLGGKVKARVTCLYVRDMVQDFLSNEKVGITIVPEEDKDAPEGVVSQAISALIAQIADDVLFEICKKNGVSYEEVE